MSKGLRTAGPDHFPPHLDSALPESKISARPADILLVKQRVLILPLLMLSVVAAGYFAYQWRQSERRRIETVRWTRFVMDSLGTTLSPPGPPVGAEGRDSIYWQWVATTAQLQS